MFKIPPTILGKVYDLMQSVTPLATDCGQICKRACCSDNYGSEMGIYLFPGEEERVRKINWLKWESQPAREHGFPPRWQGQVHFVNCHGICARDLRPLQCRFFPLAPHLSGRYFYLLLEPLALPYTCPLLLGQTPLRQDFIKAVDLSWQILLSVTEIKDLVELDSKERDEQSLTIILARRQ